MRHVGRLVFICVTVLRYGLDELALSSFRQGWVRALVRDVERLVVLREAAARDVLRYFDLATVIQTLIGSHQTGVLAVTQDEGRQKLAEMLFFKGNICRAKFRNLTGDDAVFQLFQAPLEGEFSFTGRNMGAEEAERALCVHHRPTPADDVQLAVRDTREVAQKYADEESVGLLTDVITDFEKNAWFLRATLDR